MVGTDDADSIAALRAQLARGDNAEVRDAIILALAIADLKSDDAEHPLAGVESLRGSLYPEARNALDTDRLGARRGRARRRHRGAGRHRAQARSSTAMAETLFFGSAWARCWCWRPSGWPSPSASWASSTWPTAS
jgi:hypothetical protein